MSGSFAPAAKSSSTSTIRIGCSGTSGRALFHPLRLALTAREKGPEMAKLKERLKDKTDEMNREVFQIAVALAGDPEAREWAMRMTQVARAIERIGDNAVDIGEQVVFVVTGLNIMMGQLLYRAGKLLAISLEPFSGVKMQATTTNGI